MRSSFSSTVPGGSSGGSTAAIVVGTRSNRGCRHAVRMSSAVSPTPVAAVAGRIGAGCSVAAFVVVAEGATVGDECVLHPHAVVGADVSLGDRVEVFPGAVIGREPKGAGAIARSPSF